MLFSLEANIWKPSHASVYGKVLCKMCVAGIHDNIHWTPTHQCVVGCTDSLTLGGEAVQKRDLTIYHSFVCVCVSPIKLVATVPGLL